MPPSKNLSMQLLLVAAGAASLLGCAGNPAKEVIASNDAPAAIGPYSQAIKAGGMLFLSGQIPIGPRTSQVNSAGPIEDQTKQVMDSLKAVFAADGLTMNDVVSTTVFLEDLNDFSKMNTVYGGYFNDKPPARATK